MRKYDMIPTDTVTTESGQVLYRIKALTNILMYQVKIGDLGGYVYGDAALSHSGQCWVGGKARIYDSAKVCDDAFMCDRAHIHDQSHMYGHACMSGNSHMHDYAHMRDHTRMHGNSHMHDGSSMYDNAYMFGHSCMRNNSSMRDNSRMYGHTCMYNNARMYGSAIMHDSSCMRGDSTLSGTAQLSLSTQLYWKIDSPLMAINSSDGYTFAYNAKEDKISVGDHYFTYDEAVSYWRKTRGGTPLDEERISIIKGLRKRYRSDLK